MSDYLDWYKGLDDREEQYVEQVGFSNVTKDRKVEWYMESQGPEGFYCDGERSYEDGVKAAVKAYNARFGNGPCIYWFQHTYEMCKSNACKAG